MTPARPTRVLRSVPVLLAMCVLRVPAWAQYSGGSGDPNDPYQIATAADLIALGASSEDHDKYVILTADIDLDPNLPGRRVFDEGVITGFTGVFNGNGHTISGLTITGGSYLGLFSTLWDGASVFNLGLEAVDINGTGSFVGGLAGYSYRGMVANCYSTGTVSGSWSVGGLVGHTSYGDITTSYSSGTVSGEDSVGGLVGWASNGHVITSYSTGTVDGEDYVGGLVGRTSAQSIDCSFWDIQTSGQAGSSGGKGLTTRQMKALTTFRNGGWAGTPWVIKDGQDYPRLDWENRGGDPIPEPEPLPLPGSGTADDPWQVWTAEDFAALSWHSQILGGNLRLMVDLDLSGVGLYPIGDIGAFKGIFDGNGHVIRNAVVNMPDSDYVGLFGNVDPNGQIGNVGIEDAVIAGREDVGGLVASNRGTITACFADATVSGNSVGGLVGSNYGGLDACYATGAVSGSSVGGLVGNNYGSFDACYAAGVVTGSYYGGGLVGRNYQRGIVSGSFWDVEASGRPGSSGGKGLAGAQMKSKSVYQKAGWAGTPWVIRDGQDYPRLDWESRGGDPIPESEQVPLAGSGTAEDPWQIWTAEDFALLSWYRQVLNGNVRLMDDLDVSSVMLYPIGDIGPFVGVFDGNGHIIGNAAISQPDGDYIGLFGYVGQNGAVSRLRLEDAVINGRSCVGGLAGHCGAGVISNCDVTGSVSGYDYVGGLVGWHEEGTISGCSTDVVATGHDQVGGLAGHHFGTTISNCCANGSVTGQAHVGGLVGHTDYGTISGCCATAMVAGTSQVGGLAGYVRNWVIRNCYATGSAAGEDEVGGLVGYLSWVTTAHCYAAGAVTGISRTGGLVGYRDMYSDISSCFWDVQASGFASSAGGTGKTTAEMKDSQTYQDGGWDLTSKDCDPPEWTMPANDYPLLAWQHVEQAARSKVPSVTGMDWQDATGAIGAARFTLGCISWVPSETADPGAVLDQVPPGGSDGIEGYTGIDLTISCGSQFSGGSGTAGDPYQIKTVADWILLTLRPEDWDQHVALIADLDVQGLPIGPIGDESQPFCGSIQGNGHVIHNAVISHPDLSHVGLVGYLKNGCIENLGVANTQVNGGTAVGALVGSSSGGVISCCYADGGVAGSFSRVGGLVGDNSGGTISNCYASCSVTGSPGPSRDGGPAGLVGLNSGTGVVANCYATGAVSSSGVTHGLVGGGGSGGRGPSQSVVRDSFWDMQTSGQATSAGGTGKTTAELQTASTFLEAGWDFVGETENGIEDIWWILEGQDYPRLWWESSDN